jgi:hypothetical protein
VLIGRIRGFEHELRPGAERSDSPFRERLGVAAAALADALAARAIGGGSRIELSRLHHATAGRAPAWRSASEARAWLRRAIVSGQVAVFRRVPPMGAMGHGEYAAMLGIDRGTVDHAAMAAGPTENSHAVIRDGTGDIVGLSPVSIFAGTGASKGLPDDLSETCPSPNWRSESESTAVPEVRAWLDRKKVTGARRERTLGRDGGGGFVATTTQVRWLDPGTTLYRYVNSAHEPWGGWWFLQPMQGDPRVYAALPPDSSAQEMVVAVTKDRLDVLYGPGAPRCSNKPGGPDQVCVAWVDFHPTKGNRLTLK